MDTRLLLINTILNAIKPTFLFSGSDISLAYSTNSFRNSSSFIAFSNLSSSYKEKKNACNKIEKESWSPRALHQQQMNSRVYYFFCFSCKTLDSFPTVPWFQTYWCLLAKQGLWWLWNWLVGKTMTTGHKFSWNPSWLPGIAP